MLQPQESSKRRRAVHLLLLLALAFGPYIYSSFFYFVASTRRPDTDAIGQPLDAAALNKLFLFALLCDIFVLGLFVFFLRRQGRRLSDFGLNFHWWDIPLAALISAVAYSVTFLWFAVSETAYNLVAPQTFDPAARNVEFITNQLTLGAVVFVFVNPFYEELLVRAYTMTEVEFLTERTWLAVAASVIIQASYHLYQGPAAVWMMMPTFIIFSLFFAIWKRITPVILAHLYFDLIPVIAYLEQR
jgi:hypothetical protein